MLVKQYECPNPGENFSEEVPFYLYPEVTDAVYWCSCYYGKENVFMHKLEVGFERSVTEGDYDGRCRGWYMKSVLS